MGRTVLADELVQSYLEKIATSGQWHIGLMIGQVSQKSNFIDLLYHFL